MTVASLALSIACSLLLSISGCSPAAESEPSTRQEQTAPAPVEPAARVASEHRPAASDEVVRPAARATGGVLASIPAPPAGMPPPPKVSAFAPAADLAIQVEKYVKGLEKVVAEDDDFNYIREKIANEANTLIVIALALGLHDEPNAYRDRAGAIMETAAALAVAADLASARKAVAAVRQAADGKRKSALELKWGPAASLPELMKQVPLINTKLKRNVKGERFQSKAKLTAGYTAVIAAIAQGSMADLSETKDAAQVKQWYEFMAAMRDAAGALNAAIHNGDGPAGAEAMKKLSQSCNDCHAVFHPEAEIEQ